MEIRTQGIDACNLRVKLPLPHPSKYRGDPHCFLPQKQFTLFDDLVDEPTIVFRRSVVNIQLKTNRFA
jgi:hypothetical protein